MNRVIPAPWMAGGSYAIVSVNEASSMTGLELDQLLALPGDAAPRALVR